MEPANNGAEDNFKVPSLDSKIKFIPRKSIQNEIQANVDEYKDSSKEETVTTATDDKPPKQHTSKPQIIRGIVQPKCSYIEPKWSTPPAPEHKYFIEVLKNGTIVETITDLQKQSYWLIGKLPDNHITMAHPTISRYHAVLQYRPSIVKKTESTESDEDDDDDDESSKKPNLNKKPEIESGFYLYDLNSTHGSFVNKTRIPPKTYVRVRVGYMIKFGASTRRLILQGPEFDAEEESELTITEIKEQRRRREEDIILKLKEEELRKEREGVNWGMAEDADEETDLSINPFASTNNEELFLQDPKKTLRGFFEREGFDLEYKVDEMSPGTFVCRIELPIHDANGRAIVAEVCHKGKKKDCVFQCALEACRMLDRQGVLRQANHESRKRKVEKSDSDDDDEFFDRTGAVERKRIEKAAISQSNALSYAELLEQEQQLLSKLADIDVKIEKYQELEKLAKLQAKADDDLDDFMSKLSKEKTFDKTEIRKLRVESQSIKNDHVKLQRLINIARPIDLPPLQLDPAKENDKIKAKKNVLPLFGKRGTFKFSSSTSSSGIKTNTNLSSSSKATTKIEHKSDEEEMEEEAVPISSDDVITIEKETHKSPENSEKAGVSEHNICERIEESEKEDIRSIKRKHQAKIKEDKDEIYEDDDGKQIEKQLAKKRRNRIRIRGERGRENVDFDDSGELVDNEKYSTWVPPENQSGDGSTTLNDKYGY